MTNIFDDLPTSHLPDELTQMLLQANNVRIERIVSCGHSSASDFWYDQAEHEWVIVLRGEARLQFEDHVTEMKTGDFIHIEAHQKHRVAWTAPDEPTVWLALFYGKCRTIAGG